MNSSQQAWLDQEDAHLAATIRHFGWSIQYIGGGQCGAPGCDCKDEPDEPPFAYTVGLFGLNHPELLMFGVTPDTAVQVLNEIGGRVRAGDAVVAGQLLEVDGWNRRIIPEPVPNAGEIVFSANRFYQRPDEFSVPVLQLSYDDAEGRFPWDRGYADTGLQPRPGDFQA